MRQRSDTPKTARCSSILPRISRTLHTPASRRTENNERNNERVATYAQNLEDAPCASVTTRRPTDRLTVSRLNKRRGPIWSRGQEQSLDAGPNAATQKQKACQGEEAKARKGKGRQMLHKRLGPSFQIFGCAAHTRKTLTFRDVQFSDKKAWQGGHGRVDMAGWKGRPRQKKGVPGTRAVQNSSRAKSLLRRKGLTGQKGWLARAKSNQGLEGLQIKEAQQCMKAFWAKRVTSA